MDNRLRSIAKMQWVWLMLNDLNRKSRFWSLGYGPRLKHCDNETSDMYFALSRLYPILTTCGFCEMSTNAYKWARKTFGQEVGLCHCVFRGYKCLSIGRKLRSWLEGGCDERDNS